MPSADFRLRAQRLKRRLARFGADRSATAAIEFAAISPFFIAIVLVSVMTGVIYMARSQLDTATQTGARSVMVGASTSTTQLKTAICNAIGGFFNCSNLMVSVTPYNSFTLMGAAAAAPTLNYNGAGAVTNTWGTSFGGAGSIMVLQVMYQFPMIGTSLFNFATQANGTDLLISTAVFINE